MNIIMNEREYAESAIERCTFGPKPVVTLMNVAKYYRAVGCAPREIRNRLEKFILKCDAGANKNTWSDIVEWCIKNSKAKLVEVEGIHITKEELDVCNGLQKSQLRRLMFTLICLAKFSNIINTNNHGWVNRKDKDIFSLANVVTSVRRQSLMMNELMTMGLIRFSKKVDNINICVCCLYPDGESAAFITDMRNLGYQYQGLCGEPTLECENCGIVVPKKSNCQKYCNQCSPAINRVRTRIRS